MSETKQKHAQKTKFDKWKSLINFPGTLLFEESVISVNIYHVSRLPTFGTQGESKRRIWGKKSGTSKEK